jgi:esterase/lipase
MISQHPCHILRVLKTAVLGIAMIISNPVFGRQQVLLELEESLHDQETKFSDIVEGVQKSIRWANGVQQTAVSIVYIHGFSASSKEISPVTEKLADLLGANVFYTRLTGHGRSEDAMATATVEKWLDDTRQAYEIGQLIGQRVVVISVSTGGTLAAWLATQDFAKDMAANIMISPNFGIKNRSGEIVRWPLGFKLAKWLSGPYREFTPQNELHKKYWTERYPIEAVIPMVKLVDQINALDYSKVKTPHLMMYSPTDQVIRVDRIKETASRMTSAEVTQLPYSNSSDPYQHVLAGDACSAQSTDEVIGLLENYLQTIEIETRAR